MLAGLPTQVPDGAGDDELVECAIEAGGNSWTGSSRLWAYGMRSSQSSIGLTID